MDTATAPLMPVRLPRPSRSSRSSAGLVGLEIEPSYVAAAEVAPPSAAEPGSAPALTVERAAAAALEPGVVRDGEVADPDALAEALRELFRKHSLGRRVRLGVANQRIVVRTLDLPPVDKPKELEAAVRFQAPQLIPMPLEQTVLDHQVVWRGETPEGERMRVVLVAARRELIDHLLGAARAAGLRPEGVDLSAFAMVRCLADPAAGDAPVIYVSVGGMINLAVAVRGQCVFTRVVPGGLEAMAAALAERRELTLEHARMWLTHVGLELPVEAVEGDAAIVSEARAVLVAGTARVADEIRNSMNFFRTMGGGAGGVSHAVLTGAADAVPGFAEGLSAELRLRVARATVVEARPGVLGEAEPGRVAVAAGLAVAERPGL